MSIAAPPEVEPAEDRAGPGVALRIAILAVLCAVVFREATIAIVDTGLRMPHQAHGLAALVLVALLVWRRRDALAAAGARGSWLGLGLVGLGLLMYVGSSWPFAFAIPRRLALVPTLAGAIALAGGWRVLARCVPMLALLMLAIPIGTRFYAAATIRVEEATIGIAAQVLALLPGVETTRDGLDILYERGGAAGAVALGHSYRAAAILLAYATVCVYATFVRIRPWWQVVVMAVLCAGPIVLLANLVHLVLWGAVTIVGGAGPLSIGPRLVAIVGSIVVAYGLTLLVFWVLDRVVSSEPESTANEETAP